MHVDSYAMLSYYLQIVMFIKKSSHFNLSVNFMLIKKTVKILSSIKIELILDIILFFVFFKFFDIEIKFKNYFYLSLMVI